MGDASKFTEFQIATKAEGLKTTKRWQFNRDSAGLMDAVKILTPLYITGIINKALRQEAFDELQGTVTFSVKKDKDEA